MKTLVVGLSGLGSGVPIIGYIWQRPVRRVLDDCRKQFNATTVFRTWRKWKDVRDFILAHHEEYDKIIIGLAHSLGATKATYLLGDLESAGIVIDLAIIGDEALDGGGSLSDIPIGNSVRRVVELHWGLDQIMLKPDYTGEYYKYKVEGGHTGAFLKARTKVIIMSEIEKAMKR